jgi:hypothetical protein
MVLCSVISFIFNFQSFLYKNTLQPETLRSQFRCYVPISLFNTRMGFLRRSQGRYGEKTSMLWGHVNFVCMPLLKQCENMLSTVLRPLCLLSASKLTN